MARSSPSCAAATIDQAAAAVVVKSACLATRSCAGPQPVGRPDRGRRAWQSAAPLAIRIARLQTWRAYLPTGGAMAVLHAGMPKRSGIFQATATLAALGVVYGDICTSPLYALKGT